MSAALVLGYHAVSERWPAALSATPGQLERHVELLIGRGYRPVTFSEAVEDRSGTRAFAVTFDDAYRSVYSLARPLLERLGVPGTLFVPTAYPGRDEPMAWPGIDHWRSGEFERELVPMSWDQVRELAGAGWEIGSHTHTHPHLTQVDDGALDEELVRSRAELERQLGRPCQSIAYPYGDVDERVIAAADRAGYRSGAALPTRLVDAGRLAWPRIGVYNVDRDWRFRLKVAPAMVRLRESAAWSALSGVRRLLG